LAQSRGDHLNEHISRFFVRQDAEYDAFVDQYQARTSLAKVFYLFMHLLPGLLAWLLINVPSIHAAALQLTGWTDTIYQSTCILGVFAWHILIPFLVLRYVDKLSVRRSAAFLSLSKFDAKGFFLVMPVTFILYTALSLPYMNYAFPALTGWIAKIPGLNPPEYSIFRDPSAVYGLLPASFVVLGLIGNFLCEEIYFRGYLMKKIGFLGRWAWLVNSVLFALYHVWQAPTTWPLLIFALFFGLLMQWRKNLYPLIPFHFLVNIVWGAIVGVVLK
jgi:uncharacterized protein